MNNSVITVIGKDRVGIVYDVSRILAENQINILNISQQLMDDFFTMIILVDTSKCPKSRQEMRNYLSTVLLGCIMVWLPL